jgi:hypothetical protein
LFETNAWITKGIKTSCKHKQVLYQISRTSNNQLLKKRYRKYCKILTQVNKEAKRMHFNKLIVESDNKIKTVWKIVEKETGKQSTDIEIPPIKINDTIVNDSKHTANSFITYF